MRFRERRLKNPDDKHHRMPGEGVGTFDTGVGAKALGFGASGVFEKLYQSEYSAIRRFLSRKLGNDQDAQELTQEVFVKIWKADNIGAIGNVRAFVYRVAANLAVDLLRRQKRERNWQQNLTRDEADRVRNITSAAFAEQSLEIVRKQQIEAIMKVIKQLPVNCQIAFILNKYQGLNYSEVAVRLEVSKSMVEKHISRALAALRAHGILEAGAAAAKPRDKDL